MNNETKSKLKNLINLDNITDPNSGKIECIADCFPGEYSNEDEYIEFQTEIGNLVLEIAQEIK